MERLRHETGELQVGEKFEDGAVSDLSRLGRNRISSIAFILKECLFS